MLKHNETSKNSTVHAHKLSCMYNNSQLSHKYNHKYKNPISMYEYLKSLNDQICCNKVSQHTPLSNTFLE